MVLQGKRENRRGQYATGGRFLSILKGEGQTKEDEQVRSWPKQRNKEHRGGGGSKRITSVREKPQMRGAGARLCESWYQESQKELDTPCFISIRKNKEPWRQEGGGWPSKD